MSNPNHRVLGMRLKEVLVPVHMFVLGTEIDNSSQIREGETDPSKLKDNCGEK